MLLKWWLAENDHLELNVVTARWFRLRGATIQAYYHDLRLRQIIKYISLLYDVDGLKAA